MTPIDSMRTKGTFLLLFAAAVATAGCGLFDPKKDTPDPVEPPKRDTPVGALHYFAYVQQLPSPNIEDYDRCLHSLYQFHFTPEDVGEIGQPFWSKQEDVDATANMFAGAIGITMTITVTDTLAEEPCFEAPDSAVCKSYECLLDLAVEVPEEPENRTYLVHGFADISVTQDEFDPSLWVIANILDRTSVISRLPQGEGRAQLARPAPGSALAAAEEVSWGELRDILSNRAP